MTTIFYISLTWPSTIPREHRWWRRQSSFPLFPQSYLLRQMRFKRSDLSTNLNNDTRYIYSLRNLCLTQKIIFFCLVIAIFLSGVRKCNLGYKFLSDVIWIILWRLLHIIQCIFPLRNVETIFYVCFLFVFSLPARKFAKCWKSLRNFSGIGIHSIFPLVRYFWKVM